MDRRNFVASVLSAAASATLPGIPAGQQAAQAAKQFVYVGERGPGGPGHRSLWEVVRERPDGSAQLRIVRIDRRFPTHGSPPFSPHRVTPKQLKDWFSPV